MLVQATTKNPGIGTKRQFYSWTWSLNRESCTTVNIQVSEDLHDSQYTTTELTSCPADGEF